MGTTDPINNTGRRTGQGDALSPVSLILTIKPLIQWLAAGSKHWKISTSTQFVGPLAFADNLALSTGSTEHMTTQNRRITAFLRLSGLETYTDYDGNNKTAITSLMHGRSRDPNAHTHISWKPVTRLPTVEPHMYLSQVTALKLSRDTQFSPLPAKISEIYQRVVRMVRTVRTPSVKRIMVEKIFRPTAR